MKAFLAVVICFALAGEASAQCRGGRCAPACCGASCASCSTCCPQYDPKAAAGWYKWDCGTPACCIAGAACCKPGAACCDPGVWYWWDGCKYTVYWDAAKGKAIAIK
jgi:hypothetical protein